MSWISKLFGSKEAVQPPALDGVFRAAKNTKAKQSSRPVTDTLFERPADLPIAQKVQIVSPTTEADHYKWLDYQAQKPTEVVKEESYPEPVKANWPYNPSGSFILSGIAPMICFTGRALNFCSGTLGTIRSDLVSSDANRSPSYIPPSLSLPPPPDAPKPPSSILY